MMPAPGENHDIHFALNDPQANGEEIISVRNGSEIWVYGEHCTDAEEIGEAMMFCARQWELMRNLR